MGVSKNSGKTTKMDGLLENPIKMDDLGVPLFLETPIFGRQKQAKGFCDTLERWKKSDLQMLRNLNYIES